MHVTFRRIVLFIAVVAFWSGGASAWAASGGHAPEGDVTILPHSLDDYEAAEAEQGVDSLGGVLKHRIAEDPFNLFATIIFGLAILHTFAAGPISKYAHKVEHDFRKKKQAERAAAGLPEAEDPDKDTSFWATVLHFFGEVEAIFGIWCIPLLVGILVTYGWHSVTAYVDGTVNYTEPMFVVVIMAMASTRPILKFSEQVLGKLAGIGGRTPGAWWLSILIVAPLLGSFITEPAAMTIGALLLGQQFYRHNPPRGFMYATLGLLFVNVSVGGTLTHFAAPPVLMVAGTWGYDLPFMFTHYGLKAVVGIVISTTLYYFIFRKHFTALKENAARASADEIAEDPVPFWVTGGVLAFMAWTVFTLHHPVLFIGGFLVFFAFVEATRPHHYAVSIKGPLLVGFFLAGLVTHGAMQQWWIAPVLSSLGELPLFLGATALTAVNDNAAITFLASQVPAFATGVPGSFDLQYAVLSGAVVGGGLTVIANAPNPAGQSILQKYFGEGGVSPAKLFMAAIVPTIIVGTCFRFLPH